MLRFGTNSNGLAPSQLALISANGFTGFALNASGYLTASALTGYGAWASTNAPTTGFDADEDGDEVANGVEVANIPGVTVRKNDPEAGRDTVTLTLPLSAPKKFARLKVTP